MERRDGAGGKVESDFQRRTVWVYVVLAAMQLVLNLGRHPFGFYTSLAAFVFFLAVGISYRIRRWRDGQILRTR